MTKKVIPHARKMTVVAACAFLAACGGGGDSGGGGGSEGRFQVITFKYPGGGNALLNPATTLSATATSGLPISFRTGTPTTCTVADDKLTLVAAGECLVIASQPGGAGSDGTKWAAADDTSQLFNVLKHAQVVDFTPPDYVLSAATKSVALSATSDSGLPFTFSSDTPAICSISGSTLQLLAKGTCAVAAKQAGNESYKETTTQRYIAVDPLLVADGFMPLASSDSGIGASNMMATKQGGGVSAAPWSTLIGGWQGCPGDAANANWCYRTVSSDGSTLTSVLHVDQTRLESEKGWFTGFNNIDIFAPGLTGFKSSGDTTGGLQVVNEQVLGFTLGMNSGLQSSGNGRVIVHLDLGKRYGVCNVRLSTLVWAPQPGLVSYAVPLSNFVAIKDDDTEHCTLEGAASKDDVQNLPNPYDSDGRPTKIDDFNAALAKLAGARTLAATLLKSSPVIRVGIWVPEPGNTKKPTGGVYATDLTIKGAITIQ